MKTDMHVLWVQQLAVLPIIVEDRGMADENVQGRGLPLDPQTGEPSARGRLGERERPTHATQARMLSIRLFFFYFFSLSLIFSHHHYPVLFVISILFS